jgi:hypothetical protein
MAEGATLHLVITVRLMLSDVKQLNIQLQRQAIEYRKG